MLIRGKAWKFGDDVDTDVIIPYRYLVTSDPEELGKHCMEAVDPEFPQKIGKGDIIVAGKNFGCGSSREHAPISIKAAGVSCVIARTFARIFYRNAINIGLPILECPEAANRVSPGDQVEVDLDKGEIRNMSKGEVYHAAPFPPFMQEIIASGGLMNYVAKQVGLTKDSD